MPFVFADILQPLEDVADSILVFLHDRLGFGWGMAIVGMTVIVRIAILPLTIKQIRSMNALRELQPEVKEIQEKYKDDRQRDEPGDDEVLQGEPGQPVLRPACRCCFSCRSSSRCSAC